MCLDLPTVSAICAASATTTAIYSTFKLVFNAQKLRIAGYNRNS